MLQAEGAKAKTEMPGCIGQHRGKWVSSEPGARRWAQGKYRVRGIDPHPKKGQLGQANHISLLGPSAPGAAARLPGLPGPGPQSSLRKTRWAELCDRSYASLRNEMLQPGCKSVSNTEG